MTSLWPCPNPIARLPRSLRRTWTRLSRVRKPKTQLVSEGSITMDELAQILNVPVATLYKWRQKGERPPTYRICRCVRYRPSEVLRWLTEQVGPLAVCSSECGKTYPRNAFKQVPGS